MRNNHKLGAALALVGMVTGMLILFILADIYTPNIVGKIADGRPDEAITVRIVFALLGWLGVAAGALWTMVFYGPAHPGCGDLEVHRRRQHPFSAAIGASSIAADAGSGAQRRVSFSDLVYQQMAAETPPAEQAIGIRHGCYDFRLALTA